MSETLPKVIALVAARDVRVSAHGYDRMVAHAISASDITAGIGTAEVVEDYPGYHAGPAMLVLQYDPAGSPIHTVWGIEKGTDRPAVLVTAYRPDPDKWAPDYRTRKP